MRGTIIVLIALVFPPTVGTKPPFGRSQGGHQHIDDSAADSCLDARGGGDESAQQSAEEIVEKYFSHDREAASKDRFHVQGWRWHTLSLVRDSRRLETLALRNLSMDAVGDNEDPGLEKAAKHVVDFNMAGLHRIENELFFPWMREKLCSEGAQEDIRNAFSEILDGIDEERRHVAKLGQAVTEQAKIASSAKVDSVRREEATSNVARMSAALNTRAQSIMDREERFLVPAVAAAVPEKEQKSFNNRVIRKLGILDSRLHLVGMHDAVWEGADEKERELFNEAIPSIPRMMIPRWRRLLYEPAAGVLDSASD